MKLKLLLFMMLLSCFAFGQTTEVNANITSLECDEPVFDALGNVRLIATIEVANSSNTSPYDVVNPMTVSSPSGSSIVSTSPSLPTTVAINSTVVFTVEVIVPPLSAGSDLLISLNTTRERNGATDCETLWKEIPPCATCNQCDSFGIDPNSSVVATALNDNQIQFATTFTGIPAQKTVKKITAEVLSFGHIVENEVCRKCANETHYPGQLHNSSNSTIGGLAIPYNHPSASLTEYSNQMTIPISPTLTGSNVNSVPFNWIMSVPPEVQLSCCDDKIAYCIRYTVEFEDCSQCSFIDCGEIIRGNDGTGAPHIRDTPRDLDYKSVKPVQPKNTSFDQFLKDFGSEKKKLTNTKNKKQ